MTEILIWSFSRPMSARLPETAATTSRPPVAVEALGTRAEACVVLAVPGRDARLPTGSVSTRVSLAVFTLDVLSAAPAGRQASAAAGVRAWAVAVDTARSSSGDRSSGIEVSETAVGLFGGAVCLASARTDAGLSSEQRQVQVAGLGGGGVSGAAGGGALRDADTDVGDARQTQAADRVEVQHLRVGRGAVRLVERSRGRARGLRRRLHGDGEGGRGRDGRGQDEGGTKVHGTGAPSGGKAGGAAFSSQNLSGPETPCLQRGGRSEATRRYASIRLDLSGGAEGIRTPDLLIANETRYQLRHSPKRGETLAPGFAPAPIGRAGAQEPVARRASSAAC